MPIDRRMELRMTEPVSVAVICSLSSSSSLAGFRSLRKGFALLQIHSSTTKTSRILEANISHYLTSIVSIATHRHSLQVCCHNAKSDCRKTRPPKNIGVQGLANASASSCSRIPFSYPLEDLLACPELSENPNSASCHVSGLNRCVTLKIYDEEVRSTTSFNIK